MEGQPLRAHLESWQRQTGKVHPKLASAPSLPVGCNGLWLDFIGLHQKRGGNGFAPSPITEADIHYRQQNRGVRFAPWEVKAIERADRAYLEVYAENHKVKS